MKVVSATETHVHIELSRRNLLSLLAKLDGHPPNSACTIISPMPSPIEVSVTAVEDEAHYSDRPAGQMVQDTEDKLREQASA